MDEAVVHIVDDDPQLRQAIGRLLRSHDYEVQIYESALDFLNRAPGEGVGCVILDLSMPEMNGLEVQERIAESRRNLVIVFVSGQGDIPTSVKAMKAGAFDFLTKPFEERDLITAVRQAMLHSGQRKAANDLLERDWAAFSKLTPREQEVCLLVAKGRLNKQIAGELGPTEKTIKLHRGNVMRKLKVDSVAELVRLVQRLRDAGRIEPGEVENHTERSDMDPGQP